MRLPSLSPAMSRGWFTMTSAGHRAVFPSNVKSEKSPSSRALLQLLPCDSNTLCPGGMQVPLEFRTITDVPTRLVNEEEIFPFPMAEIPTGGEVARPDG